ncbi:MAG: biotin/lipoyl-binding protein, partial [Chloroflexota bacterium]|nr:biotin/lipoyl-binding protein [Chloroflexota bacterium]
MAPPPVKNCPMRGLRGVDSQLFRHIVRPARGYSQRRRLIGATSMSDISVGYDDLLDGEEHNLRNRLLALSVAGVVVVAAAVAIWMSFFRGGGATAAQAQTATVTMGDVTKSVSTSGTVAAKSSTNLNFTTTGTGSARITKVDVALGQKVTQGDVLMELDPTNAQTALDSAKLSLSIQQSKLSALLKGGTASALASVDQSVVQSQASYDTAVRAMQTLQTPPDATTLETAQQAVTTAQAQLQQATDARAKIDTDHTAAVNAAQSAVTKAQNAVTAAQQAQSNAVANITTAQATLYGAETSYCGLLPLPSPAVAYCPAGATAPISSGDQSTLFGVSSSGTADQAKAATSVLSTNTAYNKAVADEQTANNGVATAQSALSDANTALATAEAGPTAGQVAVANAAIGSAQAQLDAAQAKLVTLQSGPTQDAVAAAQSAIDNAGASLTAAQAKRDETYAGPLATDVQQQQAGVSQAQTAVATAQQNLDSTRLIAPFDGTVAALNSQAGDLAGSGTSSTTAAVVLNTPDQVVLNMTIGETDYNSVKVGQTGTAVFAGIPGRTFPIIIDSIGSSPTTTQGVVSYVAQAHFVAGGPGAGAQAGGPGAGAQAGAPSGTQGAGAQPGGGSGTPGAGGQFGGRRAT